MWPSPAELPSPTGAAPRQVAVVTGGARGIGAACARALVRQGHQVAVLDHVLDESSAGVTGYAVAADVTSTASIESARGQIERDLGPVSIVVHAAGISGPWLGVLDLDEATWDRVLAVNAGGTFRVLKSFVPGMVQRGYGRVVLVASVAGKEGVPLLPAYSASKGAVIALGKALGKDIATSGVVVNSITPAGVDTGMTHQTAPEIQERMRAAVPMGRFGTPEEIAEMVTWLSSPACSFSTGAVFDVSGGRSDY